MNELDDLLKDLKYNSIVKSPEVESKKDGNGMQRNISEARTISQSDTSSIVSKVTSTAKTDSVNLGEIDKLILDLEAFSHNENEEEKRKTTFSSVDKLINDIEVATSQPVVRNSNNSVISNNSSVYVPSPVPVEAPVAKTVQDMTGNVPKKIAPKVISASPPVIARPSVAARPGNVVRPDGPVTVPTPSVNVAITDGSDINAALGSPPVIARTGIVATPGNPPVIARPGNPPVITPVTIPTSVVAGTPPTVATHPPIIARPGIPPLVARPAMPSKNISPNSIPIPPSDIIPPKVDLENPPLCSTCNCVIGPNEKLVSIFGKTWHSKHFLCCKCNTPLQKDSCFEKDGTPYCEKDYKELFSPHCGYCHGLILEKCVNALGQTWHVDHFFCSQCGKPFENGAYMEYMGKAYCEEDYYSMFAPRCSQCEETVIGEAVNALGKTWHPACFTCTICKTSFDKGNFFNHEDKPYCEIHYHEMKGSLCASCLKPVVGRCLSALGKKYHPEHFICSNCSKTLASGSFKEDRKKPYCVACHIKLFG